MAYTITEVADVCALDSIQANWNSSSVGYSAVFDNLRDSYEQRGFLCISFEDPQNNGHSLLVDMTYVAERKTLKVMNIYFSPSLYYNGNKGSINKYSLPNNHGVNIFKEFFIAVASVSGSFLGYSVEKVSVYLRTQIMEKVADEITKYASLSIDNGQITHIERHGQWISFRV